MSSRVGRGRRTRVYDCNYNKGESYYRPVLDRLDGKLPAPREPEHSARSEAESRFRSAVDEFDSRHERHEDAFDSRGARTERGRTLASAFDNEEFGDEVTESLRRIRANKKASRFAEDIDFENSVSNLENRVRISDKILESAGLGSEMSSARRALLDNEERTEKRISRRLDENNSLTKWTALKSDEESAAMQRAKASRARLTDLEDEMSELSERSAAREKRAARLRQLVAEADADVSDTTVSATKVTFRSDREKKTVTF